ncbi:MAG: hemolysin family protein [bacterium]
MGNINSPLYFILLSLITFTIVSYAFSRLKTISRPTKNGLPYWYPVRRHILFSLRLLEILSIFAVLIIGIELISPQSVIKTVLFYIITSIILIVLRYIAYTFGENLLYTLFDSIILSPFYLLSILLIPLSFLISKIEQIIEYPLIRSRKIESITTMEELEEFIETRNDEEPFESVEVDMLKGIAEIKDTRACEIMVPRIDMIVAEINDSVEDIKKMIVKEGHSRIPVYEDKVDNIIGILHAKDLLFADDKTDMRGLLRAPYFIPETKKINQLLQDFKAKKSQMAIVVDEYGGVAGLVTIEDVLEEIVGEIQDEYDEEEREVITLSDGSFRVNAKVDIEELNDLLGTHIPTEGFETLGGYILQTVERVPKIGEVIEQDDIEIKILEADERRIHWVEIKKK